VDPQPRDRGSARAAAALRGFAAEFGARDPYQIFLNRIDLPEGAPRDPLDQSMWLWLKSFFPNKLLNLLGDRSEMAHSIEGRVPFLDHLLAELVCDMPVSMKVRGEVEKYALREAAKPYLTETVYRRQKHPFFAPFELKGRMRELALDTLRPERIGDAAVFLRAARGGALPRPTRRLREQPTAPQRLLRPHASR
jgi:asparagine synthase (glutamine-hydrolysing)